MESQSFRQNIRAIRKHWWLVVVLPLLAAAGALTSMAHLQATYDATTTLMLTAPAAAPSAPGVATLGTPGTFRTAAPTVANTILALIGTRPIAERVARRLDISDVPELQRSLTASWGGETDLLRVRAIARSPQAAADLANVAAEELISFFSEFNSNSARRARIFVEEQLARVGAQLETAERDLFATRRDPSAAEGAMSAVVGEYYGALTALDEARIALRETEQRLAEATARIRAEERSIISGTARIDNPVFQAIQSQLIALELQRLQISEIYTPRHPRIQLLDAQIAELKKRLATEEISTLQADRMGTAARVAVLEESLQARQARLAALAPIQSQTARLVRQQAILQDRYRLLATQHQDALLQESIASTFPAGLTVVESAMPRARSLARSPMTAAAAGLAGLVVGILASIFLEAFDDSVQTSEDAEQVLGVPVLAQVPDASLPRVAPAGAMLLVGVILAAGLGVGAYAQANPALLVQTMEATQASMRSQVQAGVQAMNSWLQRLPRFDRGAAVQR